MAAFDNYITLWQKQKQKQKQNKKPSRSAFVLNLCF
jgi:hypothetical protein